jgi:hypothetical protein
MVLLDKSDDRAATRETGLVLQLYSSSNALTLEIK